MKTETNPIDDASALKALFVNLCTGWGYNAYRQENKDRADDLLVRNGTCALLGEVRATLAERIAVIHRSIPTPSRENPLPGAEQRVLIRALEQVSREVEAVEAIIRHLPVPEDDSTWLRHRRERDFLPKLVEADEAMAIEGLRLREIARSGAEIPLIDSALGRFRQAIDKRKNLLSLSV